MNAPNIITLTVPLSAVLSEDALKALASICRTQKRTFEDVTAEALTQFAERNAPPPAAAANATPPELAA